MVVRLRIVRLALYLAVPICGVSALVSAPLQSQVVWPCAVKCERCGCNMATQVCNCTNCVVTGCKA